MIVPRLLLVFACLVSLPGWAQEATPPAASPEVKPAVQPALTVECRMVTVPARLLPTLLPDLQDDAKAAAALRALMALELSGEATLSAHLLARGLPDAKFTAQSGKEFSYATEYEPPVVPQSSLMDKFSPEALKNWPHAGIVPTAFDARQLGQTLEVEVNATADPKVFLCTYVAEHVRFEHMNRMDAGRLPDGERLFIEQPCFSTMRDTSQVQMESGQPKLIGVHRLPAPDRRFELFIMTLTVAPPKKP